MEHFGTHDQTELKEFGGFVKNLKSGSYELLFRTTISPLLAKNRAIEIARSLARCTKLNCATTQITSS